MASRFDIAEVAAEAQVGGEVEVGNFRILI